MKTTNAAATLASVVFLKIQEFARRPVQEQTRLRAQLEAVVAVTAAELAPAGRIVLDAADGAAIVVLSDPRGALRLAERALSATAAGLPLCIGVNHGAVQVASGGRTHELFSPDRHAAERRRKRLIALGATAVILIVGAGVAVRVSLGGHPKFLDGMIAKLGISAKDGGTYLRSLREKLKL